MAKVSTSSVSGWPPAPGVRNARLTVEIRRLSAAAPRTSPSSTSEEVWKLSSTCADPRGECAALSDRWIEPIG